MTAGATPMRTSVRAKVASGPHGGDVAGSEQAEAARPDVSGDAGDDGLGQFEEQAEEVDQGLRVGWVAQVGSGAEGVAGVGEDDGSYGVVLAAPVEGVAEFGDEGGGEGVAVGRGVEGEGGDPPVVGVSDEVCHRRSLSSRRSVFPEATRGTPSMKVTWRTRL